VASADRTLASPKSGALLHTARLPLRYAGRLQAFGSRFVYIRYRRV
jgi:hypothetical protein